MSLNFTRLHSAKNMQIVRTRAASLSTKPTATRTFGYDLICRDQAEDKKSQILLWNKVYCLYCQITITSTTINTQTTATISLYCYSDRYKYYYCIAAKVLTILLLSSVLKTQTKHRINRNQWRQRLLVSFTIYCHSFPFNMLVNPGKKENTNIQSTFLTLHFTGR